MLRSPKNSQALSFTQQSMRAIEDSKWQGLDLSLWSREEYDWGQ